MSNHLSIATVTAALRHRLEKDLQVHLPGATATTVRPQAPPSTALPTVGVNIFLFQVTPNTALRNEAVPTRRADGQLQQRPVIALDLHYLLSFYGAEVKQEPQVALGIVARSLEAQPVLTREVIQAAVAAASHLTTSNLDSAVERVRFVATTTSVEELSKLWSVFQAPYALSATYQGSVVMIEADTAPRAPALPVRRFGVRAQALGQPVIDSVLSQSPTDPAPVAGQPILVGHRLILRGQGLQARTPTPELDTRVRVGDAELAPEATSDTEVIVLLPTTLRLGAQRVQVVHRERVAGVLRQGAESGATAIVLQPEATFSVVAGDIQVTVTSQVQMGQQVVLLLNQFNAPAGVDPKAYSLPVTLPSAASTFTVDAAAVAAGEYLVRVRVDGAESPLAFNETTGRYDQPRVLLP
ncbi:DUF4255 domain-containing protein [Pyxidicoccus sp. MSG2]|uniref:DUF4255 domain-containing protein n=1 Tax=Pyxidicoccus sp. MSG2 TaxID=2996790 RepID=UPI002271C62F|nr:DUF4255 domain-containing protein [Pyxidicoccus sp. MSG2]MCY1019278.1 DUF4255 domain-containing protein [Pyxidicoccus sp. MSG2]